MKYLLDTDWAVWGLRGRSEFVGVIQRLRREGLAVSAVTLAELATGIHRMRDPDRARAGLRRFLKGVEVLPFTDAIAYRFGEENARLQAAGKTISQFDLAIAVTALHHTLTLVTENRKHYERLPGLGLESLETHP